MDSTFYKKVVDDLKTELKKYIDKVCSMLHFDITKTAVVVGSNTNGYNVKFDGNTYTNVRTEITGASFSVNSTCRVMIPEANYNNMFILGGASVLTTNGGGSSSFADLFFSNTNSSVSGYKTMNYTADTTATQMSVTCTSSADVLSYVYLYPSAIGTTVINSGNWKSTFNGYVSNAQGMSRLKLVCFVYHTDGTTTDLFTKYTNDFDSTSQSLFYTETYRNQFTVASTDRLGFRIYGNTTRTVNTTIYYTIGGTSPSYINTPIALRHNQLRNLNEDSNYQHITTAQVNQIATNTTALATKANKGLIGSDSLNSISYGTYLLYLSSEIYGLPAGYYQVISTYENGTGVQRSYGLFNGYMYHRYCASGTWSNFVRYPIFGTGVLTFSSGVWTGTPSSFGYSGKPTSMIITPSSSMCSMQYDWDSSSDSSIRLVCYLITTSGITLCNGAVRFSYLIYP